MSNLPRVFIASSVESLPVARAIQENLEYDADIQVWDQGIFGLSCTTLESLIDSLKSFDFGVFVLAPDDIVKLRGSEINATRDNVIFELGLFIGRLGKKSNFIVLPRNVKNLHLPTDVLELTPATYLHPSEENELLGKLGSACNKIRRELKKHEDLLLRKKEEIENFLYARFNDYKARLNNEFVNEIICKNQGSFAQYSFLASQYHKEFKEEFCGDKPDKEKLCKLKNKLDSHLNTGFENACKINFDFLKRYFQIRGNVIPPRFCIKANSTDAEGNPIIVSLFRDRDKTNKTYGHTSNLISSNTGFDDVFHSGVSFAENFIPQKAQNGDYINPRFDEKFLQVYTCDPDRESSLLKKGEVDDEWIKCWKPSVKPSGKEAYPHHDECYKSTIVVPMTLINCELHPEFKEHFGIDRDAPGRSIYGYLCFDHHHENYFYLDQDVSMGYVFADIMSLYLISRLTYTKYSKNYKAVDQLLRAS